MSPAVHEFAHRLLPLTLCCLSLAGIFASPCNRANAQTTPAASVAKPAPTAAVTDWPALGHFQQANVALGAPTPDRVVFFGDSITANWRLDRSFPAKNYINRGISGQTTQQMLIRFRPDVIDLKPAVVLILAGTNDIAGNTGPASLPEIEGNIISMVELAHANGIRVVLSSVLPAYDYPWRPGQQPVEKIAALNRWMKEYATAHALVYLDYYTPMKDERYGLSNILSKDGVHPTVEGYAMMAPLAAKAIDQAIHRKP